MNNKFFINCDEATAICNKNQYKEGSFWEIVKLKFHFFLCKKCGLYSYQNTILTKVCDKHLHKCDEEHKFTVKEKEVLQTEIVKKIK